MTDRDTFAAAALTGLLASRNDIDDEAAERAYCIADAMLRELERGTEPPPKEKRAEVSYATVSRHAETRQANHDAAPAAKARTEAAAGEPGGGMGAGDIPDSRMRLSESEIDALEYVVEEGRIACMEDYGVLRSLLVRVRTEWEASDSHHTFAKRETDSQKAIAWLAFATDGSESSAVYSLYEQARAAADEWNWCVAPLYAGQPPKLTAEEREAVEYFASFQWTMLKPYAATLRSLLERLK